MAHIPHLPALSLPSSIKPLLSSLFSGGRENAFLYQWSGMSCLLIRGGNSSGGGEAYGGRGGRGGSWGGGRKFSTMPGGSWRIPINVYFLSSLPTRTNKLGSDSGEEEGGGGEAGHAQGCRGGGGLPLLGGEVRRDLLSPREGDSSYHGGSSLSLLCSASPLPPLALFSLTLVRWWVGGGEEGLCHVCSHYRKKAPSPLRREEKSKAAGVKGQWRGGDSGDGGDGWTGDVLTKEERKLQPQQPTSSHTSYLCSSVTVDLSAALLSKEES